MNLSKLGPGVACAMAILLSAGCDTLPTRPDTAPNTPTARKAPIAPPKEVPEQVAAKSARTLSENAMNEMIVLYDAGDYNGVIKRVSGPNEIRAEDNDLQVRAMKYMAFSYCVTKRQTLCRQQFEKILKRDPGFDLAPGEKGHPQWQTAFTKAKKAQK